MQELVESLIMARQRESKPIFVISTRNRLCVNQKCYLGKLMLGLQRRQVSPYALHRGDDTTIFPRTAKARKDGLVGSLALPPGSARHRTGQRSLGSRNLVNRSAVVTIGEESANS